MITISLSYKSGDSWININTPIFPPRISEMLDERLDECYVDVKECDVAYFEPTMLIMLSAFNGSQYKYYYFTVASDSSTRNPATGKYTHTLYLLELTKLLEGYYCPSLTFTAVHRDLAQKTVEYTDYEDSTTGVIGLSQFRLDVLFPEFVSPLIVGSQQTFPSAEEIGQIIVDTFSNDIAEGNQYPSLRVVETVSLDTTPDDVLTTTEAIIGDTTYGWTEQPTIAMPDTLILTYVVCFDFYDALGNVTPIAYGLTFTIYGVTGSTRAQYTAADCVDRIVKCAVTLLTGESPRFSLADSERARLSKIVIPDLSMTQATLREQLQVLGKFLHAESWLDENFKIHYQPYQSSDVSGLEAMPYVYRGYDININDYCTELRSNAQNLVADVDSTSGIVRDPAQNSYSTLRSETIFSRITDSNAIVRTYFPIYGIKKVMCGHLKVTEQTYQVDIKYTDITAYVYEKTTYSSQLSTYQGDATLQSKAYAMYYTLGERGLNGMFYRAPTVLNNAVFGNYAIVNILAACGALDGSGNRLTLSQIKSIVEATPELLLFNVEYMPIYPTTVSHSKGNLKSLTAQHFTRPFNQSENMIDSKAFGENMKGTVERMGNPGQMRTYIYYDFDSIPETGQTIDGYVISAADTEIYPYYLKSTVRLSKDFNRISEYVGVPSVKRMYEISERQTYARDLTIDTHIYISTDGPSAGDSSIFSFRGISDIFQKTSNKIVKKPISYAEIECYLNDGSKVFNNSIILPCVATAFGNTASFYFKFKDNYSAGDGSTYISGGNTIKGYWDNDVRYTDNLGRISSMRILLKPTSSIVLPLSYAASLPEARATINASYAIASIQLDKDNRESISVTINAEFVAKTSDDVEVIVHSGMASACSYVSEDTPNGFRCALVRQMPYKFAEKYEAGAGDENVQSVNTLISTTRVELELPPYNSSIYAGYVFYTPSKRVTNNNQLGGEEEKEIGNNILFTVDTDGQSKTIYIYEKRKV